MISAPGGSRSEQGQICPSIESGKGSECESINDPAQSNQEPLGERADFALSTTGNLVSRDLLFSNIREHALKGQRVQAAVEGASTRTAQLSRYDTLFKYK